MLNLKWKLTALHQTTINRIRLNFVKPRERVFCIGLNKTGTTSWTMAMRGFGYVVGSESRATAFFDDWLKGDFTRIIDYCKSDGDAFQDIPFSLPGTFRHIDRAFPGSKFVLTIRNSADEWYNSLVSFHAKHFSESGSVPPTEKDLEEATYWRKGFIRDYCQFVLGTPINAPYEREAAINFYNQYNQEVMEYFESRSRDLLVLNVSDEHAYSSLCSFLGLPACDGVFPWENKT